MTFGQRLVFGLRRALKRVAALVREATRPAAPALGLVSDRLRPRRTLITEKVVLRQQLVVLRRQVKRPALTPIDDLVIVGASALTATWRDSLMLVRAEMVLRWYRRAFQVIWRWRSRSRQQPRVSRDDARGLYARAILRLAREDHG
jgi:putative transposase